MKETISPRLLETDYDHKIFQKVWKSHHNFLILTYHIFYKFASFWSHSVLGGSVLVPVLHTCIFSIFSFLIPNFCRFLLHQSTINICTLVVELALVAGVFIFGNNKNPSIIFGSVYVQQLFGHFG